MADLVAEYREKLLDEVVQTDEALMERYLEGEELGVEEVAHALKDAVTRGEVFPVACGVATKNLGTHALLDLIVEGVPSPAKAGSITHIEGADTAAFVFKTIADPFAGRINLFRVLQGTVRPDQTLVDARTHAKERMGSLLFQQGKEHIAAEEFGPGRHRRRREAEGGADRRPAARQGGRDRRARDRVPRAGDELRRDAEGKGDEEKVATAIRRLAEEDPTLRLRRDPQTGEEILSGMSQMHVEVALERAKRRFGVDVELHPPRVPYLETIRKESRAHARYKKQTGGRGQFGDCPIVLEPIDGHVGYEFVDKIVGGVIPQSFRPAVDKGIQEAMHHGELAGAPVQGVRVLLVDGSYHTVDSSEMAFKIAGSMAFKDAYSKAEPVLLEPIMELEVTVPDEAVGAVNGDLNSRRGRLQRDGAGGRDDDDQGRGADVGDAHLLADADVDHRRPRRLLDALPPLRGGARPRRPEGDRGDEARARGRGCALIAARRAGTARPAGKPLKEPVRDGSGVRLAYVAAAGSGCAPRLAQALDQLRHVGELLLEVALVFVQPLEHVLARVEARASGGRRRWNLRWCIGHLLSCVSVEESGRCGRGCRRARRPSGSRASAAPAGSVSS